MRPLAWQGCAEDYGYVERISGDQAPALAGDDSVAITVVPASGWDTMICNWKSLVFSNSTIRQPVQAALIPEAGRGSGFYEFYPSVMPEGTVKKRCDYAGWWCSVDGEAALDELLPELEFGARFPYWEQLQTLAFQEVPLVYLGQVSNISAQSTKSQGVTSQAQIVAILWNCWLQEESIG